MKILLFLLFIITANFGWSQILTFDFAGIAGNEASVNSNTNNPAISVSSISRGAGVAASANGDRFNATGWSTVSIADAIASNDYLQFIITPVATCDYSISSISIQLQRSGTGPSAIALRSSIDAFAANLDVQYAIVDNTSTQTFTFTFTQSNITSATTYRFYMFAEAAGGTGGIGDGAGNDIIVNGSTNCPSSNTITTGIITGSPFSVDCSTSATGSIDFTSTGTFDIGNNFNVELSNAAGSFTSPTIIGSLTGATAEGLDPSGTISFTIPAAFITSSNYLIRINSSAPITTGSVSSSFTINLIGGPCTLEPPHLTSVIINSCDGLCLEGDNEIVFGTSGDYSFDVNTTNFDFLYGATFPGTNYTDILVNNATRIAELNTAAGCGGLFVDATGGNVPANANWMLVSTAICEEALTWNGLCGTGPIYVIFQNDVQWQSSGNFANNPSAPGTRFYRTSITTTLGSTFTIDYTTDGSYPNSDGVYATFDSNGGPATLYGDNNCTLNPVLLPSDLVNFKGQIINSQSLLTWETSSEQNNDYFTISHSTTGYNFEAIGQVQGAGNSTAINNYNLSHDRPTPGINYYKLTSTDFDGTTYIKGIVSLLFNSNGCYFDAQTSEIKFNERSDYRIFSMDGKLLGEVMNETSLLFNQQGIVIIQNLRTGLTERLFIP